MLAPARLLELIRDPRIMAAAVANATAALTNEVSAANQQLVFTLFSKASEQRRFSCREIFLSALRAAAAVLSGMGFCQCYLDATGARRWTSASKRGSFRSGSHNGFHRKSP
jgi:hypothetical protein